jgi:hypothetical protein
MKSAQFPAENDKVVRVKSVGNHVVLQYTRWSTGDLASITMQYSHGQFCNVVRHANRGGVFLTKNGIFTIAENGIQKPEKKFSPKWSFSVALDSVAVKVV